MFEVMLGGGTANKSMFIREVSSAEFITGDALASAIGLTAGTTVPDVGWLHFEDTVDGLTKYVSKRPLRHTISWDQIHDRGAAFGTRTVVIKGKTYKVRLLSGANSNSATGDEGYDAPYTHGCEWNRLMYHISVKPFGDVYNTLQSEGIAEGDWAAYTEVDLITHPSGGLGSYQWCQETGPDSTKRVCRAYRGVSYSGDVLSLNISPNFGWRPILELVE